MHLNAETEIELARLSNLVDLIYQAALNPYQWKNTLLAMGEWLNAPMALLFTPRVLPKDGGFYFTLGISETTMELWRTRYQPMDIWITTSIQMDLCREGIIFTGDEIVPTKELEKTVWYQEFLSKIGIGQVLANTIYGLESQIHHTTFLSFFRDINADVFTAQDRWKSSLLLPHLSRAMGMAARLRNADYQVATSLIALNSLPHGILLIGENEEVIFSNEAALRILNVKDGLSLQIRNNQNGQADLIAQQSEVQENLEQAIREAIKPNLLSTPHFSKTLSIPRPSGRQVLSLSFSSLPSQNDFMVSPSIVPRAVIFISDNEAMIEINREILKNTYRLTKAEIRTAEWIVEGKSLEEASSESGLSINTLKTHLHRIYDKTNTPNRAMLVKLLMTLSGSILKN